MPAIKCFEVSVPQSTRLPSVRAHCPPPAIRPISSWPSRFCQGCTNNTNTCKRWSVSRKCLDNIKGALERCKIDFCPSASHITAKLSQVETLMDPSYWTLKGAAMLTMLNDWGALWQGDGGLASYFYTNTSSLYFNTFDYFSYFAHVWFIFIVYNLWWSPYLFLVAVGCSWQPWLMQLWLVGARNFASEIPASKTIGRMLGKTSPAMFRSHPCGKSESKEHVTLPCWIVGVFGDSSRNRIDRQWQVLASHWQLIFLVQVQALWNLFAIESWHMSFLTEKGPKLPLSFESNACGTQHAVFCQYDQYLRKVTFHDWISDVPKICCELESPEPLIEANILA